MRTKKIIYLIAAGVMALGMLTGCSGKQETASSNTQSQEVNTETKTTNKDAKETDTAKPVVGTEINIAVLNGPTGMGMAKLMEDEADTYHISLYQSPDEIVGKIVSGEVDIACIPSNLAAVLYNKTKKDITLLGTNTLGVLYIVENGETVKSLKDLKDKKILMSGKGAAPEFIFDTVLSSAGLDPTKDVTVTFVANHTDVVSQVVANPGTIGLLPEPHVSIAQAKEKKVNVAIDLNAAWQESQKTDLPMGVIVARSTFIKERGSELEAFLESYKKSVDFVNSNVDEAAPLMAKYKIIPSEAVAKTAIPKCNIVFKDAQTSKECINKFYQIISTIDPKSVGGKVPDEAFYYSK